LRLRLAQIVESRNQLELCSTDAESIMAKEMRQPLFSLLAKALPVFSGREERLDHFRRPIVAAKTVEFGQPVIIAGKIPVRRAVRVALQIAKVFHQHKRSIKLLSRQRWIPGDIAQGPRPRFQVRGIPGAAELSYRRSQFVC